MGGDLAHQVLRGCRTTRRTAPGLRLLDCPTEPGQMNQRALRNELDRTRVIDPGDPADRFSRQRQDDRAQSRAEAARHGGDRGHRQRVRRDRPRPSAGRAVERGCRAAQQRLPVLHGARRHRRHVDQSVCRPGQGQGPVLHPRRDRDHRPRRPGADPAHLDDRPDRRGALHARRRGHDRRRGQRCRHARPPARGGQAGGGGRPPAADQDRSCRARRAGRRSRRGSRRSTRAPRSSPVAQGAIDPALLFNLGFFDPATKSVDVQRWLRDEAFAGGHQHDQRRTNIPTSTGTTTASAPSASPASGRSRGPRCRAGSTGWRRCAATICCGSRRSWRSADRPDQPVVLHGVQHLFHPPVLLPQWPSEDRRTRMVFITRDLPQEAIEATLTAFEKAVEECRRIPVLRRASWRMGARREFLVAAGFGCRDDRVCRSRARRHGTGRQVRSGDQGRRGARSKPVAQRQARYRHPLRDHRSGRARNPRRPRGARARRLRQARDAGPRRPPHACLSLWLGDRHPGRRARRSSVHDDLRVGRRCRGQQFRRVPPLHRGADAHPPLRLHTHCQYRARVIPGRRAHQHRHRRRGRGSESHRRECRHRDRRQGTHVGERDRQERHRAVEAGDRGLREGRNRGPRHGSHRRRRDPCPDVARSSI